MILKIAIAALVLYALYTIYLKPKAKVARPVVPLAQREALAILGLSEQADADEIRAAHRRLVAAVHPDKGGSAELTRRINAARDVLLHDRS